MPHRNLHLQSHLRLRAANAPQPPNIPRPRHTATAQDEGTKEVRHQGLGQSIGIVIAIPYLFLHAFGWSNTEKTRLGREKYTICLY